MKEKIQDIAVFMIAYMVWVAVVYVMISFVIWSPNPAEWGGCARVSLLIAIVSGALTMAIHSFDSIRKYEE